MKRLWIAAALLGVMLAGSLTNAWYAQSMTEGFNRRLEQAPTLAREEGSCGKNHPCGL